MTPFTDTIVAPITAPSGGAIAVVRVSGIRAFEIAQRIFLGFPGKPEPRKALFGTFANGDDGLALPFPHGSSFTGEETVEFSIHGSQASVESLIQACLEAGARLAQPGEFSLRAFMNGKLDLAQAEGIKATVEAITGSQLRQANLLRNGSVTKAISQLSQDLTGVLAAVEASTDFSEEVGELDRPANLARLALIRGEIATLLETQEASLLLRHGRSIALVGLPNAGKSSLFNSLLGVDRAIVTPIPGTTRDTVEETLSIHGVPTKLIDTAGLRESIDLVEKIGVERSLAAAANCDLVWYVYDATLGWTISDEALLAQINRPTTILANKIDLVVQRKDLNGHQISASTGEGMRDLLANLAPPSLDTTTPFLLLRHYDLLREADEAIVEVEETLRAPVPTDLAAIGLRSAIRILGEITGETTPPDVLERIFQDFCIGK
ncbi:MAG: tRNA uridine-5-carboxymethylaminomethyl(34) synthesis GTPase MnmE [Fimbriimonadaceae bacterium]|jgi:tRNA modification GTPase|nr:tRNA uridine-5-carboxymethylaminomethyl(34) synthesis GTPase MnmE [Fimbriimonadaceae bacterium]